MGRATCNASMFALGIVQFYSAGMLHTEATSVHLHDAKVSRCLIIFRLRFSCETSNISKLYSINVFCSSGCDLLCRAVIPLHKIHSQSIERSHAKTVRCGLLPPRQDSPKHLTTALFTAAGELIERSKHVAGRRVGCLMRQIKSRCNR